MPGGFCSSSATRQGRGKLSPPPTSLPPQGRQQTTNLPGQESKGGNIHHFCIWEPPSIRFPCPAAATHSSVQLCTGGSGAEQVRGGGAGSLWDTSQSPKKASNRKSCRTILAKTGFFLDEIPLRIIYNAARSQSHAFRPLQSVLSINWHLS